MISSDEEADEENKLEKKKKRKENKKRNMQLYFSGWDPNSLQYFALLVP